MSHKTSVIDLPQEIILNLLPDNLPKGLNFHNPRHSQKVVCTAIEIAGECHCTPMPDYSRCEKAICYESKLSIHVRYTDEQRVKMNRDMPMRHQYFSNYCGKVLSKFKDANLKLLGGRNHKI